MSAQDTSTHVGSTTNATDSESASVVVCNVNVIFISGAEPGSAQPYPSEIVISGQSGTVNGLSIRLQLVNHNLADDLDVLLVGPGGQSVLLMSDAGGVYPIVGGDLIIFDGAAPMPDEGPIASGAYRPSNYGEGIDYFPSPAPPGPYGTSLSVFNGTNPNGIWKLYVMDDTRNSIGGEFTRGWCVDVAVSPFTPTVGPTRTPTPTRTITNTPTPNCGLGWHMVPSPNRAYGYNVLTGVSVLSNDDVWVVGHSLESGGYNYETLTMHWDGNGWTIVPSPNTGVRHTYLEDVVAVSHNDVWAVGHYEASALRTLIMHWDGIQWSIVPSPSPSQYDNRVLSVEAVSSNDIWAVGCAVDNFFALHWDGSQWSNVPTPGPHSGCLSDVAVISANDVWALGFYLDSGLYLSRALHWDGTQWSIVPTPNVPGETSFIYGVSASSSSDVWAVGFHSPPQGGNLQPLILHWDGAQWTLSPSPSIPSYNNQLRDVTAIAANDAWAVGFSNNRTLMLHWDGAQWTEVAVPMSYRDSFDAIASFSAQDIWAVGNFHDGSRQRTLVQRYYVPCVLASPTPTITGTPPTATRTPTATATYTPGPPTMTPTSSRTRTSTSTPTSTGTSTNTPTATATPTCGPAWTIVGSPNINTREHNLWGVAAISPDDVWTVGDYFTSPSTTSTLIMHWDGTQWSIVPSPNPGATWNVLSGIVALSANDVWAVGSSSGNGEDWTLVLHWDGTQWSIVPSPNSGSYTRLKAVTAISTNDIWAVGERGRETFTMHWDGTQWSIIPIPIMGTGWHSVRAVAAVSSNDVWMAGYYSDGGSARNVTMTMHWNGTQWSIVPSPNPTAGNNYLYGLTAVSANNVWAVGSSANVGSSQSYTLALRWDGNQWNAVPSPNPGSVRSHLWAVVAHSADDIWAVGMYSHGGPYQTLVEHWNGNQWRVVPSPNIEAQYNRLYAVSASSTTDMWAVGSFAWTPKTLVLHYYDSCGLPQPTATSTPRPTNTPVPVPTNTPVPVITNTPVPVETNTPVPVPSGSPTNTSAPRPTNTSVPVPTNTPVPVATNTSVPLPTLCPIQFRDVGSNNAFYASVRCLACRGIVSGYADGTFRPDNLVTRGQLAKIVSNAGGFMEDPGPQIFQDVLTDHTFYEWINRLTNRGYMSGYACGSSGEPCVNNRPYFRPFANATRAQTSKIVANAARYNDPPVGQTFEDVPVTHPFYEWLQRLASRDIMGGYTCGGPGEPCILPLNKPYFRPYKDVTRGQSAKIVAGAFACSVP